MPTEAVKSDWTEIKTKIKARFEKLTDEHVEALHENVDRLSAKLQNVYGYAKEQADKEITSFKATLHAATEPEQRKI